MNHEKIKANGNRAGCSSDSYPGVACYHGGSKYPENTIQADDSRFITLGKVFQVNVGDIEYELDFSDNKTMTFTGIGADSQEDTDTVEYTAIKIRPQVYMVYWHEP